MGKYEKKKSKASFLGKFTSNKIVAALFVCILLLILTLVVLVFLVRNQTVDEEPIPTTEATTQATIYTSELITDPTEETLTTESTEAVYESSTTEASEPTTEATTAPTEAPKETTPKKPVYVPPAVKPTTPAVVIPQVTVPPKVVLSLPYVIPGTNLVVERIASFDGIYLEDGTDAEVSGIAMILVYNAGVEFVEYANITMKYDDITLKFELSGLAPGARVACQEIKKSGCSKTDLVECTADFAVLNKSTLALDQVDVTDNGDNTITVNNLTDQDIVTVRVFYKYYLQEENTYLGGITFTAKLSNLGANESIVISPSHYTSGASKVIMIRAYDEDV